MLFEQRKLARHGIRPKSKFLCICVARRRISPQPSQWKCHKYNLGRISEIGHTLDSTYWQSSKVFWQTIRRHSGIRSNIARSIKEQLSYSVMRRTHLADGESVSKTF